MQLAAPPSACPPATRRMRSPAMMLAQLLATGECQVQSVSFTATTGEVADLLQKRTPAVVCISATPPAAVMHARHLGKIVRGRLSQVPVAVGLWDAQGDLSKARTGRIGGGARQRTLSTTLAEALGQVRLLFQPLLPPAVKEPSPDRGAELVQTQFR